MPNIDPLIFQSNHNIDILLSVSYNDENENITNNVLWFNSSNERDMIRYNDMNPCNAIR